MKRYYAPPETFSKELGPDYFAVVNPFVRLPVSVITARARDILIFFKTGRTRQDCYERFAGHSKAELDNVIREFLKAQLLFTTPRPKFGPPAMTAIAAWLHITNRCNLKCKYCYLEHTDEDMSEATAVRVVDSLFRSVRKRGIRQVLIKFAGGEAILNYPTVFKAIRQADKKAREVGRSSRREVRVRYQLLTNGVNFPAQVIDELRTHQVHLLISLDGLERSNDAQRVFPDGKGTFRRIMDTLDRLRSSGIAYSFSTVVSALNVAGLPELLDFYLKNDLPFVIDFYRENPCSRTDPSLNLDEGEFLSQMRKALRVVERYLPRQPLLGSLLDLTKLDFPHPRACGVGQDYLVFDERGKIARCQMALRHVVSTCDSQDPLSDVRKDRTGIQNQSVDEKKSCRRCLWRYYCAGGCPFLAKERPGSYGGRSRFCRIFQELVPEIIRLEGLRLLKWAA